MRVNVNEMLLGIPNLVYVYNVQVGIVCTVYSTVLALEEYK